MAALDGSLNVIELCDACEVDCISKEIVISLFPTTCLLNNELCCMEQETPVKFLGLKNAA